MLQYRRPRLFCFDIVILSRATAQSKEVILKCRALGRTGWKVSMVSVEKVEEALKAIEYPNVQSVQIIYNIFRQRPAELLFKETKRSDQVEENLAAADLPALPNETMSAIQDLYDARIRPLVHYYW